MSGPPGASAPTKPSPTKQPSKTPSPSGPVPQDLNGVQPSSLKLQTGVLGGPQRIVIYGTGGIGKSELCWLLHLLGMSVVFIDTEGSTKFLDASRYFPQTFDEVRALLHDKTKMAPHDVVVVDTFTTLEDFAVNWTIANVKHEKGHAVNSIEGYGWGKGYTHVYETFLKILGDLDALVRAGKHVIGVCHDCIVNVPNPSGEDWIRYEPRLQQPPKNGQLRSRVKEWCDHLLFLGYNVNVGEDGKAENTAITRSIYPVQLPTHLAKSRTLANRVDYPKGDPTIWKQLFEKKE